ncbi:MAG: permease prefix domain 1-containing protein [Brachybacterium sp.]|uniref:permease prefix domain 1-containing protein n=1 Tax=Brachybacterium sp. TaxID=1891286 RepID=UPI0026477D26|nr:permease prefix domain 1-containing protein [Brachybacterium sp.]MDN5687444.1 permease prefix domain 1-containing protein [Brachybacterium sp.]
MATTLTERYISATIASLPPETQDDVRAELETSIADAVEARQDQGEDAAAAERAALTELGDPAALAAGYADRPLHLLGPRYYLAWWRLLKLLLAIVPACVAVAVALALVLAGADVGEIIGQTIAVTITATVHLFFWTTLVFVVLERTGADTGHRWDVDQLPEARPTGTGRADLIASVIFGGLGIGALLWDRFRSFVRIDGESISILHPELWPWALLGLFVLIAAEVGLAAMLSLRGRWTVPFAVLNTALAVLFLSWALTLLGNGLLVNPVFLDVVLRDNGVTPETMRIVGILLVFSIVGFSVWDIIDGWVKTRRDAKR